MPNVTVLAALVAGMLSFLSPCVLPLVPPYLVYLTGTSLERFADALVVPVFNHAILRGQKLRDQFPFRRAAAVPLQIPILPTALKFHADQMTHSFADFHSRLPVEIPIGHAFELRSWTKRAFLELRELELRLLLERLRASLRV